MNLVELTWILIETQ